MTFHQSFPLLKRKAGVSHLHRLSPSPAARGSDRLEVYCWGPGWRQNQPGFCRALSTHPCAFSKTAISEHSDICHGYTFQGQIWPSILMRSGNCSTVCKEHSWQEGSFRSFVQLQKRESCCPCAKLGTSTMPSSQNSTQMPMQGLPCILDFSLMTKMMPTMWPSVPTNKITCCMDEKTPTLTVVDGEPFVFSSQRYFF